MEFIIWLVFAIFTILMFGFCLLAPWCLWYMVMNDIRYSKWRVLTIPIGLILMTIPLVSNTVILLDPKTHVIYRELIKGTSDLATPIPAKCPS